MIERLDFHEQLLIFEFRIMIFVFFFFFFRFVHYENSKFLK